MELVVVRGYGDAAVARLRVGRPEAVVAAGDDPDVLDETRLVLQIDVGGSAVFFESRIPDDLIVVGLGLESGSVLEVLAVLQEDAAAALGLVLLREARDRKEGRNGGNRQARLPIEIEIVGVNRQVLIRRELRVGAESDAELPVLVVAVVVLVEVEVLGLLALQGHPVLRVLTNRSTVTGCDTVFLGASEDLRPHALGVRGLLRDDIDDAVHGIRAPDRSAGSANHFDAFDVRYRDVLLVPYDAAEERRVDAPAVQHDEQLVRELLPEAANRDGPARGVDAGHLHAGNDPERLGHAGEAAAPKVLGRDHGDRRGRVVAALGLLGDRSDLDVHEVLEAQLEQIIGRTGRSSEEQKASNARHGSRRIAPRAISPPTRTPHSITPSRLRGSRRTRHLAE